MTTPFAPPADPFVIEVPELPGVCYYAYHRSRGLGPQLIRLRQPLGWSNHVSILYAPPVGVAPEPLLDVPLIEARSQHGVTGPGHHPRTLRQAVAAGDEVEVWQQLPVAWEAEERAKAWLLSQVGKGYDVPGLAIFLPVLSVQRLVAVQEKREREAYWWCSELGQAHGVKRGFPPLLNVQPWQVDPEWLRSSPLQTFVWASHGRRPVPVR